MKILLTCEDYLPQVGGAEICVQSLAKELRLLGHSVIIFTNTVQQTESDEEGVVRIPWRFVPQTIWQNARTLFRLIGEVDVVHCTYSFRIAALCALLCLVRRKPMLLTQQGKGIVPEVHPKWHNALLVKLCQHVSMRLATQITSTSDEITQLTAAFVHPSKITLISNGYDARLFRPDASLSVPVEYASVSSDCRIILSVRRLVPKNGIHIFVQALTLLKEINSDFHYFAIGEGRNRSFIEQLIAEGHLEKHVTLLGARKNDELRSYYQHADLLVIPSSAEARSIACIEAMGMEKPLIASRVGGLIDLLGTDSKYGQLVKIYDDESCTYDPPQRLSRERLQPLVEALADFLRDPTLLCAKASDARRFVQETCSWEQITKLYVQRYLDLCRISETSKREIS